MASLAPALTHRERIAAMALLTVAALILANALFNLAAQLAGASFPLTSFLTRPDDNLSDFFAPITCYPYGAAALVIDRAGLHGLLPWPALWATPPAPTGAPMVTVFHLPPLGTLIYLGLARLVAVIDPVVLFLITFGGMAAWWTTLAHRFAHTAREGWLWAVFGLISYPTMLIAVRGNILAGLTVLLLAEALLLSLVGRRTLFIALLFALALNLRPNAALLAIVPWAMLPRRERAAFVIALAVATAVIGLSALALSERLFPAYSLSTFRAGLALYYRFYAIGFWGLPYGSSLFGAMKLLTAGYHSWLNGTALAIALIPLLAGYLLHRRGALSDTALLQLAASAYCLGSTVLGDYHLAIFLLVPMAIARERSAGAAPTKATYVAGCAACLALAPKNYLFWGTASAQVLFNPIALLATAIAIVAAAWPRPTPAGLEMDAIRASAA